MFFVSNLLKLVSINCKLDFELKLKLDILKMTYQKLRSKNAVVSEF